MNPLLNKLEATANPCTYPEQAKGISKHIHSVDSLSLRCKTQEVAGLL